MPGEATSRLRISDILKAAVKFALKLLFPVCPDAWLNVFFLVKESYV